MAELVIVDASVALKWVIEEQGSLEARRLVSEETLAAPSLLFIECANVLWAKARRGQIQEADARIALQAIDGVPIRSIPVRPHISAAQTVAFELHQTAYDSLYLAAALAERGVLVTADEAFARAARANPLYASSVRLLTN